MVSRLRRLFLAAGLWLLWGGSVATASGDACGGDEAATTACAEQRYLAVDAELNAAYVDVMNRLQDTGRLEQKTLLRDSQRAWILFRDGECEFKASGTHGGSAYPMVLADCLADLTALRTTELKAYLVCQEGDLSCPTW